MINVRVTTKKARELIGEIPHGSCQSGSQKHWVEGGTAGVTAQSICWLYCWAKTGMNSANAAQQSRQAFNQIFDRPYEWFDARVPHEWARLARYRTVDIESDLIQWFTDYKN